MVDIGLVRRKLVLLENYKRELAKLPDKSLVEFRKDFALQKAVEKILEEMIQVCIDIAKHIIADEKLQIPDDNKGTFDVLRNNDIISQKVCDTFKKMAGFRNILVHLYEKIDIETVYINYRRRLGDFTAFAKEIEKYLSH